MRILYCNKYNFGFSGTEAYLFSLMRLMRERGNEVALFSMEHGREPEMDCEQTLVPHRDFKDPRQGVLRRVGLAGQAIYSRQARRALGEQVSRFLPEVAHVRNIYHHLSPSILWELKRRGVPVLYHLNDFKLLCPSYNLVSGGEACERCAGGQYWRVLSEGCYQGSRAAAAVLAAEAYVHHWLKTYEECVDMFLAPSQFVRDKLVAAGWDGAKIRVLAHFQSLPEAVEGSAGLSAGGGDYIAYFGRLSREKGVSDLLQAMRRLPRIALRIAGEGPERVELEAMVRRWGLRNVEFLGHITGGALEHLVGGARFTVFPSHAYETLGKSILESYARGKPVIASDLGSRRELVQDGKTGVLYPVGDVEELADGISFLYERPELTRQMGRAGRTMVKQRHDPEEHYRAMVAIYEEMIGGKAERSRERVVGRKTAAAKLRVAFIGGRGVVGKYSGIEAYYEEVGKRLAGKGHEVTVYCRNYFTPALANCNGMRLVRLPTVRSKHLETVVHTLLSTVHAMFSGCQIVHYHALGPALFSFLPRLVGKKTVVTVQGLDWQRKKWGRLASAVLRLGERASVGLPSATMVVSRTLQGYYRERHGAETLYIPNGTQLRERKPGRTLAAKGLSAGNYILFLGRFSPEKNCHLLIEAFERIETSAQLVLAGGSSYTDDYTRELRKHESERVRLLDWVAGEELEELLTNAMLFVLPSDLEGLSLALLDAMGAGVCVLTSDIPENCELVEGAGFTFRRGEVADLERMLRLLIADEQVRREAGMQAKRKIESSYLWPEIVRTIERSYRQIMGWGGRGWEGPRPRDAARPAEDEVRMQEQEQVWEREREQETSVA